MKARVAAIAYHLPERVLDNESLAREFPGWSAQAIADKVGIRERRIAAEDECSSDLAVRAAQKLFASGACAPSDIDFVLFCTQTPDYLLPTTACLLQHRLGIPTSAGALDINLGCSGYVYGLGLAKGLIETGQARRVLFLTAETYTKLLSNDDRATRTIFGDAAAATLIDNGGSDLSSIGTPVYGTDGNGAPNLIAAQGGLREPGAPVLQMVGPEIFNFTIRTVPALVAETLRRAGLAMDQIDLFVFHQANQFMMEHLRKKLGVPEEKFMVHLANCGNTVSSTIPIALYEAQQAGRLTHGATVMIVGFGVGYSWAASILRW